MNMLEYYIAEKIKLTEFTYIHIKRLHIYIYTYITMNRKSRL